MSHLAKAREVFDIELAALKTVRAQLDKSFDTAVEIIIAALKQRGKIVIVGIGKSGNVGAKIAATLTSTGSTAVILNSVDALHGDVGIINDGDVLLALSYSGESDELLNLLPALKRFSVKIIALTGNLKSSLARHSDLSLNVTTGGTLDRLPPHSTEGLNDCHPFGMAGAPVTVAKKLILPPAPNPKRLVY